MQDGFIIDQMKLELKIRYHIWVAHQKLNIMHDTIDILHREFFLSLPGDTMRITKNGRINIFMKNQWAIRDKAVVHRVNEGDYQKFFLAQIERRITIPSFEEWLNDINAYEKKERLYMVYNG